MIPKKKILLLTTGGTIACIPGGEGLEPQTSDILSRELKCSPLDILQDGDGTVILTAETKGGAKA